MKRGLSNLEYYTAQSSVYDIQKYMRSMMIAVAVKDMHAADIMNS